MSLVVARWIFDTIHNRHLVLGNGDEVDSALKWLTNTEEPDSEFIRQTLLKLGMKRERAQEVIFKLLDESLFDDKGSNPHFTLGLQPGADPSVVKRRYIRLLGLYHPDKNLRQGYPQNGRAERIISAYNALKNAHRQHLSTPPGINQTGVAKNSEVVEKAIHFAQSDVGKYDILGSRIRASLGDIKSLHSRFFIFATLISLIIILTVALKYL